MLILNFLASNFSHVAFVLASYCLNFFQIFFLARCRKFDITLKFISFALTTLEIFFAPFLVIVATFGPDFILESIIRWVFFIWSFKWNQFLNVSYGHFFFFCLYNTMEIKLVIDNLHPILFLNSLLQTYLLESCLF